MRRALTSLIRYAVLGLIWSATLLSGCAPQNAPSLDTPTARIEGLKARLQNVEATLKTVQNDNTMEADKKATAIADLTKQQSTLKAEIAAAPAAG